MEKYISVSNSSCTLATYHLVLDEEKEDFETQAYLDITRGRNIKTEIWKMHNWSGVYQPEYERHGKKKTCGRPFAPDIVIRAGGLGGMSGAVHPCCQVLGRDAEAILGHASHQSLEEIWYGEEYNKLRKGHEMGEYPDYCKECDFLIDDSEVLVYSNHDTKLHQMHGVDFSLADFR